MPFCGRCFTKVNESDDYCANCGFPLAWNGNTRIRLSIPEYDPASPENSFEELVERCTKVIEELNRGANELVKEIESNLENTRNLKTVLFRDVEDKGTFFFYLSLLFLSQPLENDDSIKLDEHFVDGFVSNTSQLNNLKSNFNKYQNIKYELSEMLASSPKASYAYSSSEEYIELNEIDEKTIRKTLEKDIPMLLRPFIFYLQIDNREDFESTIHHEMTHAYIAGKFPNETLDQRPIAAIDESAAFAVNYVTRDLFLNEEGIREKIDWDKYRESRIPKSMLITGVKTFIDRAAACEGDKYAKIDFIRDLAVKSIEKVKEEKLSFLEAIGGGNEKLFRAIRQLEIAENLTLHAFLLLDLIESEQFESWTYDLKEDNIPYESKNDRLSNQPTKRDRQKLVRNDIKKLKTALTKLEDSNPSGEFDEFINDLRQALQIYEKELKDLGKGETVLEEVNYLIAKLKDETKYGDFALRKNGRDIQNIVSDFQEAIEKAEKYNHMFLEATKTLHEDETLLRKAKQIEEEKIEYLISKTEEIYSVTKKASQKLEQAENSLEKVPPTS